MSDLYPLALRWIQKTARTGAHLAPFVSACGGHPGLTTPHPSDTSGPIATIAAAPAPSAHPGAPPNQAEPTNPLLPIPLHFLPAEMREIRVESTADARRAISDAICGWPDLESRLMDTTPTYQVRELADALRNADATRSGLVCRHELTGLLTDVASVRVVSMALPSSSSENVYFVPSTASELPAPSYAHDGAPLIGVSGAKCIYDFRSPHAACTDLSDGVARSPEGKFWIVGRIVGLSAVAHSTRASDAQHPPAERVARLLAAGDGLEIGSVALDVHDLSPIVVDLQTEGGIVSGRDARGARVERIVLSADADADAVEKALREAADKLAHSPPHPIYDCHDCAPMIRALWVKREKAYAHTHEPPLVERNGKVVTSTTPVATDPELADAKKAFDDVQAKRRQLLDSILDAWRNGTVPAPDDFAQSEGPEFVRKLKEELR